MHIWTLREAPRSVVPVWSSGGRFSSFPIAKRSCVTLGKPDTPRALGVSGCLPPTEPSKNWEPVPYQRNTDVGVPYLPGPLWRWRHFWPTETRVMAVIQKSHVWERESSAEEQLYGYLWQRDIFKCFECWLRICKKRSKQTFILKVLPENTPGLIFIFLNNDSSKSPLYNHKKIKTLQGMILAV